jgi:hypothetical protein
MPLKHGSVRGLGWSVRGESPIHLLIESMYTSYALVLDFLTFSAVWAQPVKSESLGDFHPYGPA